MPDDTKREHLTNISPVSEGVWIREGECNQCGECCKTLVSLWFMTGYNREIGPRTLGCLYLSERPDGRYDCLIKSGEFDFNSLSKQVREYYLRECLNYPNPDDPAHCPPRHDLLEGCGHRMRARAVGVG